MLTDLCIFIVAVWFLSRIFRRRNRQIDQEQLNRHALLLMKENDLRKQEWELEKKTKTIPASGMDVLSSMTVRDAMVREARAKAALRAVLARQGCDEDQISTVMDSVDGAEDGDLKT
jgi:hypothetical protein